MWQVVQVSWNGDIISPKHLRLELEQCAKGILTKEVSGERTSGVVLNEFYNRMGESNWEPFETRGNRMFFKRQVKDESELTLKWANVSDEEPEPEKEYLLQVDGYAFPQFYLGNGEWSTVGSAQINVFNERLVVRYIPIEKLNKLPMDKR